MLCMRQVMHVFVGAAVVSALSSYANRHRINPKSFEKIKAGQTEAEVVRILGAPAGDYGPGKTIHQSTPSPRLIGRGKYWNANNTTIRVVFDLDEDVVIHSDIMTRDTMWQLQLRSILERFAERFLGTN